MHGSRVGAELVPPECPLRGLVLARRTQQSHSARCPVHLRMKSQGLARVFFEVAETLIRARGCARTAQRSHSARRAVHLVCTSFLSCRGARCGAGGRVDRRVALSASWWDDSVVVRVTDVAKRRRQGLVACRAALPFEGLLEDARPGVAPAPPFGAAACQSATSRRYACSAWDCSSRSAARCAVVGEM